MSPLVSLGVEVGALGSCEVLGGPLGLVSVGGGGSIDGGTDGGAEGLGCKVELGGSASEADVVPEVEGRGW